MSKPKISEEDYATIQKIFKHYDVDDNGVLDKDEASKCVVELSGLVNYKPTEDEVAALFKEMDANGDNAIQFEEFLDAISDWWINDAKT